MISSEQLRAARSLLGWSQAELAEASGVGVATIRRMEVRSGYLTGIGNTVERLQNSLEHADIEFIDEGDGKGPGVRFRKPISSR